MIIQHRKWNLSQIQIPIEVVCIHLLTNTFGKEYEFNPPYNQNNRKDSRFFIQSKRRKIQFKYPTRDQTHLKSGLVPNLLVRWGAWQITDQTSVFGPPFQLFGVRFGRPCFDQCGTVGCCLSTGNFLRPERAVPHAFTALRGVRFIAWHLRRP